MQIFDKCFKTVIQNFFTVYVASTKHKGVYWRSCLKFSQTRECSTKLCKPRWGSLILKCTCNVSKLIAEGGGEWKQYYLVREADPSVVFYLHFGTCQVVSNYSLSRFLTMGGQSVLSDPRPPHPHPHSVLLVQNTVNEGNLVLLFFADLTIYIYM